jgi:hypothetical protein
MKARRTLPAELRARIVALDVAEMKDRDYWNTEDNPAKEPIKIEPLTISAPVKIAQQVPPSGVDRFKIQFLFKQDVDSICGVTEEYALRALIRYDKSKDLISPLFFIHKSSRE